MFRRCFPPLLFAAAAMAGCSSPAPPAPAPVISPPIRPAPVLGPDACGASRLSAYVGAVPRAEIRPSIVATVGERTIQFLTEGQAPLGGYDPSRLLVEVARNGRITSFRCG